MVSNKTIKSYDFNTIDDYYNYIIDSKINGQMQQVKELIKKLSREQKTDFLKYLNEFGQNDNIRELNFLTIELI
jgi:hypothetical protein